MAKVIETSVESQIVGSSYSLWKNLLIGIILGLLYYSLVIILGNYIKTASVSGGIATIIVATVGILVMARLYMPQALLINIAVGASLWGLNEWTSGLAWYEILGFGVLLYGLVYVLFSWVARFTKVIPVIIAMVVIVVAARIAVA